MIGLSDLIGILMWAGVFFVPALVMVWILSLPGPRERYSLDPAIPTRRWGVTKKRAIAIALAVALALSAGMALTIKTSTGVSGDYEEST
jgi:hypothetical protein